MTPEFQSVPYISDDNDMYEELPLLNEDSVWQDPEYGADPFQSYAESNESSSPAGSSSIVSIRRNQEQCIPSGVLYGNLADKFHVILAQCKSTHVYVSLTN